MSQSNLAVIRIRTTYSWLNTNNEKLRNALWSQLRFKDPTAHHNRAFKQRKWDGYVEFFKKKTGRFLTGLLPEIKYAVNVFDCDLKIIDERTDADIFTVSKIDGDFLEDYLDSATEDTKQRWEGMRDYQVDHVNSLITNKRGVVFAPTSAGKTVIMVANCRAMRKDAKKLILVNKKSLCKQNYDALKEWGMEDVGVFNSDEKNIGNITISTYQSVKNIPNLHEFKALIVDEIHDMMGKSCISAYEELSNCDVRLGMSATPFIYGEKDLIQKYKVKGHFGPVFKTNSDAAENGIVTTRKLQERGTLSKVNAWFETITEPEGLEYAIYQDAVSEGIVNNLAFHNRVKEIAESFTGRTLIVVERIPHGDLLHSLIPGSIWVQGKDDLETRQEVIDKLKFGKGNVIAIATSGIFNTGVSVYVHNMINAAGGKADHAIIQRIGRGLRTARDKDIFTYVDFLFKNNPYLEKHSKIRIKILETEGHKVEVR